MQGSVSADPVDLNASSYPVELSRYLLRWLVSGVAAERQKDKLKASRPWSASPGRHASACACMPHRPSSDPLTHVPSTYPTLTRTSLW